MAVKIGLPSLGFSTVRKLPKKNTRFNPIRTHLPDLIWVSYTPNSEAPSRTPGPGGEVRGEEGFEVVASVLLSVRRTHGSPILLAPPQMPGCRAIASSYIIGSKWPLGLICRGDVAPAVKCQQLQGLLSESCNGNAECQNRMIDSAMSLSMFPRNNSDTMQMYHSLKASSPGSAEHVAFLKLKLQVWKSIVTEWGRVQRSEDSDSDSE